MLLRSNSENTQFLEPYGATKYKQKCSLYHIVQPNRSCIFISGAVEQYFNAYNIYKAIQDSMNCLRMTNMFLQNHSPWLIKDDPDKRQIVDNVLYTALETLRIFMILMQPVIPYMANDILNRFNIPESERSIKDLECFSALKLGQPGVHEGRSLVNVKARVFNKIK